MRSITLKFPKVWSYETRRSNNNVELYERVELPSLGTVYMYLNTSMQLYAEMVTKNRDEDDFGLAVGTDRAQLSLNLTGESKKFVIDYLDQRAKELGW